MRARMFVVSTSTSRSAVERLVLYGAAMSDDLLFTPAVKAAALIRTKKLSPVEYIDAVLKAADKANPRLNCFRVVMDEKLAGRQGGRSRGGKRQTLGPLHGVPISVKDLVDVKGVATRHGSAIFEDNAPAAADDILVKRLRAAGAIIIAKPRRRSSA